MARSPSTHLDTQLLHSGMAEFNAKTGAAPVALPSMRTSTVRFASLDDLERATSERLKGARAVTYGRVGMDTHAALEQVFCDLEGARRSFLASSGLGGITLAFLALLNAGDHVVVADCAYGPVRYLDRTVLRRMGITVSYCRATPDSVAKHITPATRMIYIESPGSLLFEMLDIPALAALAHDQGLVLAADNTWGAGYIYRPLELGADVSIVAGTKYIGGHSDLMLGAVMANDEAIIGKLNETHYGMGYSISADDAWLALRGVRTLPIRIRQHAEHAMELCEFFASRPETTRIYHPAYAGDPGHVLWQRDCTGSNGMFSVALKLDDGQARRFVNALALFSIGFSWGGFESLVQLVEHSALAVHGYWDGGTDAVVRFHAGLEAPLDLIADLMQALDQAR